MILREARGERRVRGRLFLRRQLCRLISVLCIEMAPPSSALPIVAYTESCESLSHPCQDSMSIVTTNSLTSMFVGHLCEEEEGIERVKHR